MPYSSDAQRKFFNAKAKTDPKFKKMASEFNAASKGMELPEKVDNKKEDKADAKKGICPHCGMKLTDMKGM